ncbi:MAG: CPBP family glutamic-type intramembrane protease [Armatimonadota bacterium]|nr:CPBP family glutamic-type intramembrane protease [Armatimonadota bacterium]MDR7404323.1 CPBP family glutamic-type intramembrane protease [Armatimonadota bacterium]MDR7506253.1 CPBP family glutamic-type intramembrane protease [Armatimonadota bacterium]MDR7515829.1 CPBP family glutamic-type intramembrane protease [Armatimonadota bacterium]MDR7560748.1 CPBP family glutamic-type intramembrane protease [Armatimonadota bacterium]
MVAQSSLGQVIPAGLTAFALASALAAAWVWRDARARLSGPEAEVWVWAVGTLVALPVFLPLYLLAARPVGRTIHCPVCGRPTLSHRASCLHCGHPLAFDAPPGHWGLGEAVGVAVVFLVTLPVAAQALGLEVTSALPVLSAVAVAQNALFVGLALYVVRRRYRLPGSAVGLTLRAWPQTAAVGLAVGAASVSLSVGAEHLAVWAIGLLVGRERAEAMAEAEHARDVLAGILRGPLTGVELAWVVVLVCVLVPVGEELYFRGLLYGALRPHSPALATAVSAVVFAAVHQQVIHFLPILLLGVVLAVLYQRTGSLVGPMVVHGINNLVAVLAILNNWNV